MRKLILTTVSIFFGYTLLTAQIECGGVSSEGGQLQSKVGGTESSCSSNSTAFLNKYETPGYWQPTANDPEIVIPIAFHIMDRSTNPYWEVDDVGRRQFLDNFFMPQMNNNFMGGPKTCSDYLFNTNPPYKVVGPDKNIVFELVDVYYYGHDPVHSSPTNEFPALNYLQNNFPERLRGVIPIIFDNGSINGNPTGSGHASASNKARGSDLNFGYQPFVRIIDMASDANSSGQTDEIRWARIPLITHELLHTLGLLHTYAAGGTPNFFSNPAFIDHLYFDDIFGIPFPGDAPHIPGWLPSAFDDPNDKLTSNTMGGNRDDNGFLSQKQVNLINRNVHVQNISRFVKSDIYSSVPMEITESEVWDFRMRIYKDLIIKTGVTLTVSCRLTMPDDAKIVIEPGAKLIIDGGEITAPDFGNTWEGIYVYGNSNLPQTPANQGVLEIKNGGKLSHASTAIANYQPGTGGGFYTWGTMGGIISARDAIFENNGRDVELVTYRDGNKPYLATFKNCSFSRDGDYRQANHIEHVTMWDVQGIVFENCDFDNQEPNQFMTGRAVYTIDATYRFQRDASGNGNTFNGFAEAIRSENATAEQMSHPIKIVGNTFTNNIHSVYLGNTQGARVAHNTVNVNTKPAIIADPLPTFQPAYYGIYFDYSYNFQLSDNVLTSTVAASETSVGIVVKDNCGESDRVYKNTIDNFTDALQGIGANMNIYDQRLGLNFICNNCGESNANGTDIKVGQGDVATNQGFIAGPNNLANNLFSDESAMHINNGGSMTMIYNYGTGNQRAVPINYTPNVVPQQLASGVNYNENCPPNPITNGVGNEGDRLNEIYTLEEDITNNKGLWQQLVDNGSTPNLEADIFFADNQTDYQDLYVEMMGIAPYVSIENLVNVTEISDFPELALRNIMVANPHSAREPEVWEALVNREPALSQQTLDDIEQEKQTITAKDVLEGDINAQELQSNALSIGLLEYYADENMNGENRSAEIKTHLKYRDEAHFRYGLIDMYIAEGNYGQAQAELNAVASECDMGDFQQEEYASLQIVYNIQIVALQNGIRLNQLEATDITALENVVANGMGTAVGRARNLLLLNGATDVYTEPILGTALGKTAIESALAGNRPATPKTGFNLYPNPAPKGHTLLQWNWFEAGLEEEKALKIHIRDVQGKLISTLTVDNPKRNTQLIPTQGYAPGVYMLTVEQDDKAISTHKLAVE